MWLLTRHGEGWRGGALPAAALVLAVLVIQVQAVAHSHLDFIHRARAEFPAHLDWVERQSAGPVAIVNQGQFVAYNRAQGLLIVRPAYWTEFFNPSIDAMYVTPDIQREQTGGICLWGYSGQGQIAPSVNRCHPAPRQLVFVPAPYVTRFKVERQLALAETGRVVRTGPDPHLLSYVQEPCVAPGNCAPGIAGTTFLDRPGTVVVTFRGQGGTYTATAGKRSIPIGPNAVRSVELPQRAGTRNFGIGVRGSGVYPQVSIVLRQGASERTIF